MRQRAFTLIELLIVVAIIAILAAIAVPNFLEAQTRAKVSRVKSDMRTAVTALEAYYVDFNRYPWDRNMDGGPLVNPDQYNGWFFNQVKTLTTPIAYLATAELSDPFYNQDAPVEPGQPTTSFRYYNYGYGGGLNTAGNWGDTVALALSGTGLPFAGYALVSYGPDKETQRAEYVGLGLQRNVAGSVNVDKLYDPSNGTISLGDLVRAQGQSMSIMN